MIEIDGITKSYDGNVVVNDVSMTIEPRTVTVIVGTSGSGKTTLLRMINRLVEPTAGTIRLDGEDNRSMPGFELRRRIGYAIQGHGLFPHRTVAQNIATVPVLLGWDKARIDAKVAELLTLFQLDPAAFASRFPHELSGGQQQRVGVARALAAEPNVLLMDEPFGALDPIIRAKAQADLLAIQRVLGTTIVLVTHDMDEAFHLAHKIAVMDKGAPRSIWQASRTGEGSGDRIRPDADRHQRAAIPAAVDRHRRRCGRAGSGGWAAVSGNGEPARCALRTAVERTGGLAGRRCRWPDSGPGNLGRADQACSKAAMKAWIPHLLRAALLAVLIAFLLAPGWFDPLLKPLVQENAPAIYNQGSLLTLTLLHLRTVAIATTGAIIVAVTLAILVTRSFAAEFLPLSRSLVNVGQTFPPVAVLALAVPILGFGEKPTLVALFLYGLLPIFENTLTGLTTLPPSVMEAARGSGMTDRQRLFKVELPLAMPVILAGIRLSVVISLATATIGSTVAAKTLGEVIIAGLQSNNIAFVLQGGLIVGALAVLIYDGFSAIERVLARRAGLSARGLTPRLCCFYVN